jgi:hypothetical protein
VKRGGWLKRRKPLRRVSERRLLLLGQRIAMLEGMEWGSCVARDLVSHIECAGPVDPHEPLTRGRGGSIIDSENVVLVCRAHHGWIHREPVAAGRLGLLVHSWERA